MFSTSCTSFQCLFSIEQKTKRGFMVFYVEFIGKGVFITLVHTESACSTMSILGVGCEGFFFPMSFLPSMKKKHKSAPEKEKL